MSDKCNGRTPAGTFAVGNPGGPGRPRRTVERHYLATLNEAVDLDDWRAVVKSAVEQAKAGDARARDWLARYLIGPEPPTLTRLAAEDLAGIENRDLIRAIVEVLDTRGTGRMFRETEYMKAEALANGEG